LFSFGRLRYVRRMSDRTLLELDNISAALVDVLREAYGVAQSGEFGEPLQEILHHARDLVAFANETLAGDPQAGEHARGMAMYMAEQLAAVEALLGPIAAG
jgi:hypothetical protein